MNTKIKSLIKMAALLGMIGIAPAFAKDNASEKPKDTRPSFRHVMSDFRKMSKGSESNYKLYLNVKTHNGLSAEKLEIDTYKMAETENPYVCSRLVKTAIFDLHPTDGKPDIIVSSFATRADDYQPLYVIVRNENNQKDFELHSWPEAKSLICKEPTGMEKKGYISYHKGWFKKGRKEAIEKGNVVYETTATPTPELIAEKKK